MYGFLGMGNIGNEASLDAILQWLDAEHPDARVTCWSADPDEVLRQHGVPGTTLMSHRSSGGAAGYLEAVRKAWSRLVDIPRTFSLARSVDVVIVPGMGVLEAKLAANPWGLPYWMFLTALACRLQGRAFALVGVGAEPHPHPVVRTFDRWTVKLATYCTYRDRESAQTMRSLGALGRPGTVHPDLTFVLPVPTASNTRSRHVAIGVMTYGAASVVTAYIEKVAEVILRLIDAGYTASLVVGDIADFPLADRIVASARARRPDLGSGVLLVDRADTFEGLLQAMGRADAVIASRFHNVVAALMMAKPVVSLSYADKNGRLLEAFGFADVDQPIDGFDVLRVVDDVGRVQQQSVERTQQMRSMLITYRDAVVKALTQLSAHVLTR
jgi:polysaccharide pyruvyl transferase WcaK-like protein